MIIQYTILIFIRMFSIKSVKQNTTTPLRLLTGIIFLVLVFLYAPSPAQTAPAHLRYFGFTAIDCLYDDPLDASTKTNYIDEVSSFTNIAHMCVYDYSDDIVARTTLMNNSCVNPLLHIQNIFFEAVDASAPSGVNYDLYADYTDRWNTFKTTNASVLQTEKIGCFYVADEPYWNGISESDMASVCALLKSDYPSIPLLMVEAYTTVNDMQVPEQMDWVGFDRYGTFDPQTDPDFLDNLDTLKVRLTSPDQKIILIIDDQWYPEYETYLGWGKDTMADVTQNYYNLAAADSDIIGLIGYIWPGGLDGATHHGVRNLTTKVINKNIEIGQLIKANFSPCETVGTQDNTSLPEPLSLYPNPAAEELTLHVNFVPPSGELKLYDGMGKLIQTISAVHHTDLKIHTTDLADGIYVVSIYSEEGKNVYGKFVVKK